MSRAPDPERGHPGIEVTVDRELCIGAQTCLAMAPEAFIIDDDGLAVVAADLSGTTTEQLLAAAKECPTSAITVVVR